MKNVDIKIPQDIIDQDLITIPEEFFELFFNEQHKRNAFFIWCYVMKKLIKNPDFVPRRDHLLKKLNLGKHRYNKSITYIKKIGLMETYPTYNAAGKMFGSQYKFYCLENRVINPSISDTPGPQSKTKARKFEQERSKEKRGIKPTRMGKNIDSSDDSIFGLSNNQVIYIQSNGIIESKGFIEYDKYKPKKLTIKKYVGTDDNGDGNGIDSDKNINLFLKHFKGHHTFQTLDDSPKKRRYLTKIYQRQEPLNLNLHAENEKGAGIFFTISETDGKGRKKQNIIKVRSVFADLDSAPLEPVLEYNPSLVVESSPGKYHAYWLTDDTPIDQFSRIQKAIANKFGSDPSVKDLSRVMRIPGFYHCKSDERFLSRIIYTNDMLSFSFEDLCKMFIDPIQQEISSLGSNMPLNGNKVYKIFGVSKGSRNSELCKIVGGMTKRGHPWEKIKMDAHLFGKRCDPPMKKRDVKVVLRASKDWT